MKKANRFGKQEGIDIGKQEGVAAQRQTLLLLLQWRFPLSEDDHAHYAQQFAQIHNLDHLLQLVNRLLTAQAIDEFDQDLLAYLPVGEMAR